MAMPSGLLAPSALRAPEPPPPSLLDGLDIDIQTDGPTDGALIDPATGAAMIEMDDGGVIVDFSPAAATDKASKFNDNLAEKIEQAELDRISAELLLGIQEDDRSRSDWLDTRAKGIRLLGLKVEDPKSSVDSSVALEGMSTVRHPLLLEAVLRFQANARGELLPAAGPIKVGDKILETGDDDELAESLESDLNYYLTTTASEYYPDTDRLLFYVGFGGCGFKKVYNCPIRQRPVSESVDAKDLIVSDAATDMRNSRRVTHQIQMKPSTLRRMQLAGAYRDIQLGTPNPAMLNAVDQEIANTQGIDPISAIREDDRDFTIYECYCELNIKGYEDKKRGQATGLALPYRVVIDKDSTRILEVRRNWAEDDDAKLPKVPFVKYPFVPGLGFYDIGLVHILGNTTNALTAAWREMLDAGMFANFPGFLYSKLGGRQNTNEFRIPPGGGAPIETNGRPIGEAVMPLPYKDVSPAFATLVDNVAQTGQRVGGTAEIQIGEGRQDAPVGTTLALIEQATKIMDAVHKRLHAAQAEEFQMLKECFRQNPDAFVRSVKGTLKWDANKFVQALEDASLVPQADPNTPSHMHRLMKAMALKQLQGASPQLYNARAVDERVLHMIGMDDAETLMVPANQPPPPNPEIMKGMAELSLKAKAQQADAANDQALTQLKGQEVAAKVQESKARTEMEARDLAVKQQMQLRESQDQHEDRQSRERIAAMGVVSDIINHPTEQGVAGAAAQKFGALPGSN
ncbi:hypothetical protein EOA79_02330 [Mesorhizobium sp. M1A.F.Ca.IN.020.03.2.1]|uniref:portal protein n=1 Tax=Mesorhizobium sp. M1A.F.Ca.IN.020.03.2.1 TaxID=2496769 RepID=UPI000FD19AEB|nr:hypothetical protein [Mesorhizobium sp. M1A.F.Ca.IN.020.03.2.1]RUV07946.1 hypothetical protein EOA79_02330 [Mesorhizobium sp. M1A.F.Ca.IN.020.03.2.1]